MYLEPFDSLMGSGESTPELLKFEGQLEINIKIMSSCQNYVYVNIFLFITV